jgi:hypothetical protein
MSKEPQKYNTRGRVCTETGAGVAAARKLWDITVETAEGALGVVNYAGDYMIGPFLDPLTGGAVSWLPSGYRARASEAALEQALGTAWSNPGLVWDALTREVVDLWVCGNYAAAIAVGGIEALGFAIGPKGAGRIAKLSKLADSELDDLVKKGVIDLDEVAEAKKVRDGADGKGDEGALVKKRDDAALKASIRERTRKAREWADEHWDEVQELPPGNDERFSYHGYSDSNLDGIADDGLLSGEALGRAPGENASNIWFKQGDTFYYDQPNLAIPTERLGALGGTPRAGLAGQPGVMGVPHSTLPTGIPFDQLAVVFPAGNGYVIPIHVPPGWTGPTFPTPPGWPGF